VAIQRGGKWFDPQLVAFAVEYERELNRLRALDGEALKSEVQDVEPGDVALLAGPGALDRIALGFAEVVDAKSPFTAEHSYRMSDLALRIAERLGYEPGALASLKRAALLHDIGKLSVPNSILDKPGPLTAEEWEVVRLHPYYTQRILLHISGFKQIAHIAAAHHERLDGRGYYRGLKAAQVPLGSQILSTADMFDALTAERPYRPALPEETALRIMERDRDTGVSGACLDALSAALESWDGALKKRDETFVIEPVVPEIAETGEQQRQAA
jgi:HD-GYP domain-containing protein (c-di-GMP phosphodiesterase class II)